MVAYQQQAGSTDIDVACTNQRQARRPLRAHLLCQAGVAGKVRALPVAYGLGGGLVHHGGVQRERRAGAGVVGGELLGGCTVAGQVGYIEPAGGLVHQHPLDNSHSSSAMSLDHHVQPGPYQPPFFIGVGMPP